MSNNYPTPCTEVSNATLNLDHLLENFADALERCIEAQPDIEYVGEHTTLVHEARDLIEYDSTDFKGEVINDLFDALDEYAPPYCYFGSMEGDSACFGWWPDVKRVLEDLPRVSDPSEVEGMGEVCVYVNDHGNVTLYDEGGSIIWDCV